MTLDKSKESEITIPKWHCNECGFEFSGLSIECPSCGFSDIEQIYPNTQNSQ